MTTVIAWIIVFGILVAVHELGHFFAAKSFGMQVDEYSLGFGPALWSHRWGETKYAVRLLPLGGYVRLAGMDGEKSVDPRQYPNRPLWQRFSVIFAGPVMNLLLAAVLYVMVFGPVGMPTTTTTVAETVAHYPAAKAGVRPGDRIIAIDGHKVSNWTQLDNQIKRHHTGSMAVTVVRHHQEATYHLKTRFDRKEKKWIIGINPSTVLVHVGIGRALWKGLVTTVQLTGSWFVALAKLVTGRQGFDVTGPVGIAVMVGQAARAGIAYLFLLAAALSANLGLFNILPVPVLDGSKLFLLAVEGIRRRAMDPDREGMIHLVGMALLLVFIVFVTYHDVVHYLHLG